MTHKSHRRKIVRCPCHDLLWGRLLLLVLGAGLAMWDCWLVWHYRRPPAIVRAAWPAGYSAQGRAAPRLHVRRAARRGGPSAPGG